jgi:hypothetical protein
MRKNNRTFDAATRYYTTNRVLQSIACSEYWFAEFPLRNFLGLGFEFRLMAYLFDGNFCCHVSGSYPTYLAGFTTSFRGVIIFIALKEHPYIKLIFQNWEEPVQSFNIGTFQFTLFHDVDGLDVYRYHVTLG